MYFCIYFVIYLGVVKGKIEIIIKEGVCVLNMIFFVYFIIKFFLISKIGFIDV